jgi:hypothetical protein
MAVRDSIRATQRRLATLDGSYSRAVSNYDRTCARRADAIAVQDSLVAAAKAEVERTVVAMAVEVGADLTATLLALDAAHVRQLVKAKGEPATHPAAGGVETGRL